MNSLQASFNDETLAKINSALTDIDAAESKLDGLDQAIDEILGGNLPSATPETAGIVKVGNGLDVTSDGTISVYYNIRINTFSSDVPTAIMGQTITDVTLS